MAQLLSSVLSASSLADLADSFSAAAASFERSSGTNSGLQQPLRDLTIPRNELRSASVGPISPPAASPLGPSPVWAQQPSELQPSAHPPAGAPHRQPALLQSTPLVTPPSRPQSLLHLQQSPPAADASTGEAAAERDAQKTVSRSAGEDNGHLEPAVLASQSNDPSSEPAASTVEAVIASAADDGAQGIGAGAGAEVEAEAAASFDGEGSTSDATPPHTPDPDAASRPSSAAPVQVPSDHKDEPSFDSSPSISFSAVTHGRRTSVSLICWLLLHLFCLKDSGPEAAT